MSARPLHVMITTDGVGGIFNYTVELTRALHTQQITVSAVVLGPRLLPDQRDQLRAAGAVAVRETNLKLEWMQDPWADLRRAEELLLELEARLHPDLIHANSYFCGVIAFTAPVLVVAHSCVYSWWRAVLGSDPPPEWERYRRLVSGGLAGADVVVAPTRAMLTALAEHYHVTPRRSLVIPNGIRGVAKRSRKADFVLAAGRLWDPAKNMEALVAAARAISSPVLVAGQQRDPERHSSPIEDDHPENLRLLGRLPAAELAQLRHAASVFAAPARYEPFGLSILEAAGDSCALVLGDIESLRETWAPCGRFVPPDDHEALAATLDELLHHPELAKELGYHARMRASALSSAITARRYATLYRSLVEEPMAVRC